MSNKEAKETIGCGIVALFIFCALRQVRIARAHRTKATSHIITMQTGVEERPRSFVSLATSISAISMTNLTKSDFIRALLGSGFTNVTVDNQANCTSFVAERIELLGVRVQYRISVANSCLSSAEVESLVQEAVATGTHLVLVGDAASAPDSAPILTFEQFFDRLGGPVFSLLPFDPEYSTRLITLGSNELPKGLAGSPDTLFEEYVHAGLQFILRSRVVRYGQERLFENVTDGVVIIKNAPLFLYDAKAAKNCYQMSADSVRQFADYVDSYHKNYERVAGRLTAFVVVSSMFENEESLEERSLSVKERCGVSLSFLHAKTLAEIVRLMINYPLFRQTIAWTRVFSRTLVRKSDVETSLKARLKDGIVLGN